MKIAVSIPEAVFKRGEAEAKRRKIPRSRLYAEALQVFLRKQENDRVREKLDEIYSTEDSQLPEAVKRAQAEILRRDPW